MKASTRVQIGVLHAGQTLVRQTFVLQSLLLNSPRCEEDMTMQSSAPTPEEPAIRYWLLKRHCPEALRL